MSYRFKRHGFGGDPYWLTAKYDGQCSAKDCGCKIRKGEQAFYYPNGRKIFAKACGHADANAADFESARADEAMPTIT